MNFIDLIINRRSIRKFTGRPVERDTIDTIIKAAMYAPSAVNRQPWHFIVIDDRVQMDKIMEVHPYSRMLSTAPTAVLVCGDEIQQHDTGYWIADCGASTENLILAASSLGLGSCWVGVYPREHRMNAFRELFELPDHIRPFALVALGYPDETKRTPERFDRGKIHHNTWSARY